MALTILNSLPRQRRFSVYDFEWIPGTLQMRLCGLFDGERYKAFTNVDDFLDNVLTSEGRGRWYYAHAGGLADVQFVLEAIVRRYDAQGGAPIQSHDGTDATYSNVGNGIAIEAKFSGSSAVIVHVKQGKNVWHFVDSYWLFRDSLANIGKSIGLHKTGPHDPDAANYSEAEAREWYRSIALHKLLPYNARDCEILWKAIDRFETRILEMGGQLQMTLASTGMNLFRRKFLRRTIETYGYVNKCATRAYHASRVEVFNRYARGRYYFDINSSFPYSMTLPQPADFYKSRPRLPDSYDPRRIFIAECEVEVPDCYLPPVPIRCANHRVFFPTGRWRAWFSSVDLELLEEEGGTIHSVSECLHFEPFTDLAGYAEALYTLRKSTTDPFDRIVYKLLMNCVYGKFAESSIKSSFFFNPTEKQLLELRDPISGDPKAGVEILFPGAFLVDKWTNVPHQHVPISMHITSLSRRNLFRPMSSTGVFDYCDTDGFGTDDMLPTSNELGGLKLEKYIDEGEYIAPKVYSLKGRNDKNETLEVYHAKGMSLGKDLLTQRVRWKALLKGGRVSVTRMTRPKENIRRTLSLAPRELPIKKRLRMNAIEKRCTYPDGQTRPWTTEELEEIRDYE